MRWIAVALVVSGCGSGAEGASVDEIETSQSRAPTEEQAAAPVAAPKVFQVEKSGAISPERVEGGGQAPVAPEEEAPTVEAVPDCAGSMPKAWTFDLSNGEACGTFDGVAACAPCVLDNRTDTDQQCTVKGKNWSIGYVTSIHSAAIDQFNVPGWCSNGPASCTQLHWDAACVATP